MNKVVSNPKSFVEAAARQQLIIDQSNKKMIDLANKEIQLFLVSPRGTLVQWFKINDPRTLGEIATKLAAEFNLQLKDVYLTYLGKNLLSSVQFNRVGFKANDTITLNFRLNGGGLHDKKLKTKKAMPKTKKLLEKSEKRKDKGKEIDDDEIIFHGGKSKPKSDKTEKDRNANDKMMSHLEKLDGSKNKIPDEKSPVKMCYTCKKPLSAHPSKSFCKGKVVDCFICKRTRDEHPNGVFCTKAIIGESATEVLAIEEAVHAPLDDIRILLEEAEVAAEVVIPIYEVDKVDTISYFEVKTDKRTYIPTGTSTAWDQLRAYSAFIHYHNSLVMIVGIYLFMTLIVLYVSGFKQMLITGDFLDGIIFLPFVTFAYVMIFSAYLYAFALYHKYRYKKVVAGIVVTAKDVQTADPDNYVILGDKILCRYKKKNHKGTDLVERTPYELFNNKHVTDNLHYECDYPQTPWGYILYFCYWFQRRIFSVATEIDFRIRSKKEHVIFEKFYKNIPEASDLVDGRAKIQGMGKVVYEDPKLVAYMQHTGSGDVTHMKGHIVSMVLVAEVMSNAKIYNLDLDIKTVDGMLDHSVRSNHHINIQMHTNLHADVISSTLLFLKYYTRFKRQRLSDCNRLGNCESPPA